MSIFLLKIYQAKKARKLFTEKGLLAISPLYKGKLLSKDVEDSVKAFYESNEFCRTIRKKGLRQHWKKYPQAKNIAFM